MPDWRHRAACRAIEDKNLFFPIGNTGPALSWIEDAKAVCRRCPVIDQCLRFALESGQDAGVWGGMSEEERRSLKRRQARTHTYGPETRDQAVELFRTLRWRHTSNQAACQAVADELGIDRAKTVRAWAEEAGLIERGPSAVAYEEKRRAVLVRVRDARRDHASDYATYTAVAREFGLHPETVRGWVMAARGQARSAATLEPGRA